MAKYSTGAVIVLTITLHCDYMWTGVLLLCLSMCVPHGVYVCVCVCFCTVHVNKQKQLSKRRRCRLRTTDANVI